jgi:sterol desaturase/sphingolipid hydroxylase (fatty acid hydroxylase superfamily)
MSGRGGARVEARERSFFPSRLWQSGRSASGSRDSSKQPARAEWALLDLGIGLGPVAGGVVGYVVSTFVYYWWHRARHSVGVLWRGFHQLHHSPRRIEVVTSFYKHPAEHAGNSLLSAAIAYPLLGLSPQAAGVYTLLSALAEFVYHANVRTPRWLGWFVQRPEMHRIHHEHGRHAGNYGDLPVWDMLFGTYRNPATSKGRCGFDDDRERRVGAMLAFRDVHAERRAP